MAGRPAWPQKLGPRGSPASKKLFLYGVDLFNHGYWWEAHTAWERLWREAPASPRDAIFLQGLIQATAALVKWRAGTASGAARLGAKALAKLRRVSAEMREEGKKHDLGVDLALFVGDLAAFLEGRRRRPPQIRAR